MLLTGSKLRISAIKQCRLTALATPALCRELDVTIQASPTYVGFLIVARIADAENTYVEYKGDMEPDEECLQ